MSLILNILLLLVGFVFLIKGADFFVDGSSSIARRFGIPSLIIGMTIVAMGTSLPELSVSVAASMSGSNSLAVSNVVGSNLFNLMVVLGMSALFAKLTVSREVLRRDYPFSVACMVLLLVLGCIGMEISRVDGAILLLVFVAFLTLMVMGVRKNRQSQGTEDGAEKLLPLWLAIVYIVGGAVAIKFGGDWVVNAAVEIARTFGVSETLIGLTIVACGTSLPELVTSMVAARKNEVDMAVGNVIGSNIFNVLLILGVAAVISPISFIQENVIDIVFLLACSVLTWLFVRTKESIDRREGIVMLAIYFGYVIYICIR